MGATPPTSNDYNLGNLINFSQTGLSVVSDAYFETKGTEDFTVVKELM